jgi:cardiolipin synthase
METEEIVARNVFVNVLNAATNYVYITTPYLILDTELEEAIINAAKRSVDVRIITPGIPDKKYVYAVTRSEYLNLLKYGVSIYEYTPGFIHAKNVVSDDIVAIIGSINFDNRSFYHSYENGVLIYNSRSVIEMRKDFIKTQNFSEKIMPNYIDKIPILLRIKTGLFRLLIPLL